MKKIFTFLLFFWISSTLSQITLLKDINPGATASNCGNFKLFKAGSLFTANNGTNGIELWQTDGTEVGTFLLKDINTNALPNSDGFPLINSSAILNDVFYFSATTGSGSGATGRELWKTNGTTAGTVLVKDIRTGIADSSPTNFVTLENEVIFSANNGTLGAELWKTDGTDAGTVNIIDTSGTNNSISQTTVMGNFVYYVQTAGGAGKELYKTNGTAAGTGIVKNINPGTAAGLPSSFTIFKSSNNVLYFPASNGTNGYELWKSDGTEAGTVFVKDINVGINDSDIFTFTELNNLVYFIAYDGINETLWQTDGTSAGTIKAFNATQFGTNAATTGNPYVIENNLYFWASDITDNSGNLFDFYKFDGTNLTKLLDLNSGSAQIGKAFKIGTKIYFSAPDITDVFYQLWQTDGTAAGTIPVASQFPSSINPGNIVDLISFNDKIFFRGEMAKTGIELYVYDPATLSISNKFNKNLEFSI